MVWFSGAINISQLHTLVVMFIAIVICCCKLKNKMVCCVYIYSDKLANLQIVYISVPQLRTDKNVFPLHSELSLDDVMSKCELTTLIYGFTVYFFEQRQHVVRIQDAFSVLTRQKIIKNPKQ